jgi:hypothetical protein
MAGRRLTTTDIERLRRSLAMSSTLPPDEVRWLLDEAERLVRDRAHLEAITGQLRGPFGDVRRVLNELARLVDE